MDQQANTGPGADGDKGRVLLAEDSPTNKMLATAILREAGFAVTGVSNGRELLEALRAGAYDVILMDIFMPEMDGIEATRTIRTLPGSRGLLPIIAMTAYALESDKQSCLDAGMNDYVSKPIQKQELLETVTRWIGHSATAEEAPVRAPSAVIIDSRVIEALERETDSALLMELARAFVTETASRLSSISAAVQARDLAALEREALALKGGAGTFGAAQLVDYASALAQACLSNDLDRSIEVVRALPKVALVACKALADRYLDGG